MAPTEESNDRLSSSWEKDYTSSSHRSSGDSEQCVKSPRRDPLELNLTLQDLDNTCEIYFCGWDLGPTATTTVTHLTVPGASEDFRRALSTPDSEAVKSNPAAKITSTRSSRSPPPSSPSAPFSGSTSSSPSSSPTPTTPSSSPSPSPTPSPSSSSSSSSKPTLAAALSLALSPLKPEKQTKKSKSKPWKSPLFLPSVNSSMPSESSSEQPMTSRRPASFGDADGGVKYRHAFRRASHSEKHVSWADEFGSTCKLTSVRLIRPRLDAADSNKKSKAPVPVPGRSILRDTGAK